jgi:hypothetical protein
VAVGGVDPRQRVGEGARLGDEDAEPLGARYRRVDEE